MSGKRIYTYTNDDFAGLFKVSKRRLKEWEDDKDIDFVRGDLGCLVKRYIMVMDKMELFELIKERLDG